MVDDYLMFFLVVLFIKYIESLSLHFSMPDDHKNFTMSSHLKYENVLKYCLNRDNFCSSNNTIVCGLKMVNQTRFYKDFENACYLFMSNMCDHPHEEYFIASAGTCDKFLSERKSNKGEEEPIVPPDYGIGNNTNSTSVSGSNGTGAPGLRQAEFKMLYDIAEAFDYHSCPYSCPNIYSPVCINVNRGFGKYFKMLTFINHCSGDLYYCKNWQEFAPPPYEDENVKDSPLGWSFCGASRYLQFNRFAEAASSMGHYGWLKGDYKYSHIMEPHERSPGYGR